MMNFTFYCLITVIQEELLALLLQFLNLAEILRLHLFQAYIQKMYSFTTYRFYRSLVPKSPTLAIIQLWCKVAYMWAKPLLPTVWQIFRSEWIIVHADILNTCSVRISSRKKQTHQTTTENQKRVKWLLYYRY